MNNSVSMSFKFEVHGVRGKYGDCHVTEGSWQRNGSGPNPGFTTLRFTHVPTELESGGPRVLIGIVVEDVGRPVLLVDPNDLTQHWRGESFMTGLRAAADVCTKLQFER